MRAHLGGQSLSPQPRRPLSENTADKTESQKVHILSKALQKGTLRVMGTCFVAEHLQNALQGSFKWWGSRWRSEQ